MIDVSATMIADRRANIFGDRIQISQKSREWFTCDLWMFIERLIQLCDIRLVMLCVMDLHRLCIDVRLKCIVRIRKLWQFVFHCGILAYIIDYSRQAVAECGVV